MEHPRPTDEAVRQARRAAAPHLAEAPVSFLAEGWEFWAFRAGDRVLRFPKREGTSAWKLGGRTSGQSLRIERAITPRLAERVSAPIAVTEVCSEGGPGGLPYALHRFLPGEIVVYASRRPSQGFGRQFGRLLRELRAFTDEALRAGVPVFDGRRLREDRARHYEDVVRRAFPLIGREARGRVAAVYEAYLEDGASFDFEPVFVHTDLAVNTLIDARSGGLCGVIDFGDAAVSSPALDLWLPAFGFDVLGIEAQRPACLREAGVDGGALARMMPELRFLDVRYPLLGVLHGLDIGDDVYVREGIQELDALLSAGRLRRG